MAFVGANNQPTTMGTVQMIQTFNFGYKGKIYPVYPKEKSVLGIKAYPSIRDIPDPVDLAVITVPAKAVAGVFEDCGAKGVHYAVVTSGGFREMVEGPIRELSRLPHKYHKPIICSTFVDSSGDNNPLFASIQNSHL